MKKYSKQKLRGFHIMPPVADLNIATLSPELEQRRDKSQLLKTIEPNLTKHTQNSN